ncbi:MAG: family 10 glycosylhydrolase [Thermoguttaceae bacterium]
MNGLVLLSCWMLSAVANAESLDDFRYADETAARAAWKAAEKTRPITVVTSDNRPAVVLAAPFASQPKLRRATIDRSVSLDLRHVGVFKFDAAAEASEFPLRIALYFHSGNGWYFSSGQLYSRQRQSVSIPRDSFVTEGSPDGWDKIDTVRVALWRPTDQKPCDLKVRLYGLKSEWNDVAIVAPSSKTLAKTPGAQKLAVQKTKSMTLLLADVGLDVDVLQEDIVAAGALDRHRVALLLNNPDPSPECVAALERFVQSGGKLVVCHWLPERLGSLLGFGAAKRTLQQRKGEFSEIRFDRLDIAGLPTSVRQQPLAIAAVEPVGQNARIIARWFDNAGKPTEKPAVVLSDRGAMISHVLRSDDAKGNQQLLTSLSGQLAPSVWKQIARTRIDRIGQVGHCDSLDESLSYLQQAGRSVDDVRKVVQQAERQFEQGQYVAAIETADRAHGLLADGYIRSIGSPSHEARAAWNHSGMGVFPGDWERSAKLLADNGFNMVLPNMLNGGSAHYASDVLPRSDQFRKYGDQLEQCCAAAKRHGLEVHVWKADFRVSNASPKAWIDKMRAAGRMQVSFDGKPYDSLCPSDPANRKLEIDSMLEIAKKYPVDGLHFDYIRYPDRDHCYCDGCRKRFEADSGRPVAHWPTDCYSGDRQAEYNEWRCRQITAVVKAVSHEARKLRPGLKISAAVFGSYPNCRKAVAQDWVAWVKAGYLDFVCPMDYTNSQARFHRFVASQKELIDGHALLYPGIGALSSGSRLSADQTAAQIRDARLQGSAGWVIFDFNENTVDTIFPSFGLGAGAKPAQPPHRTP